MLTTLVGTWYVRHDGENFNVSTFLALSSGFALCAKLMHIAEIKIWIFVNYPTFWLFFQMTRENVDVKNQFISSEKMKWKMYIEFLFRVDFWRLLFFRHQCEFTAIYQRETKFYFLVKKTNVFVTVSLIFSFFGQLPTHFNLWHIG